MSAPPLLVRGADGRVRWAAPTHDAASAPAGSHSGVVAVAAHAPSRFEADADAVYLLARAKLGRWGVDASRRLLEAAPRDWRPLSLLGVAYQQVRRPDDAKEAWNEALRLSPDNADVLTNAAIARIGEGDAPSAEILLRRAAAQPGAGLQVRQNLALALGLQGKMGEAEQILRRELPPEQAEQNLRWLRARATPGATPTTASAQAPAPTATTDTARTWNSLQGG